MTEGPKEEKKIEMASPPSEEEETVNESEGEDQEPVPEEKFVHPPMDAKSKGECPFLKQSKAAKQKAASSGSTECILMMSAFVLGVAIVFGALNLARPGMEFKDWLSLLSDKAAGVQSYRRNQTIGPEPGVSISSPDSTPDYPISFTVHFNGDGMSIGSQIYSKEYTSIDPVIESMCMKLIKLNDDEIIKPSQCLPSNGAKLYKETGVRIYSFLDIKDGSRTYIVPQGILFVYPLGKVGRVIYPETVAEVIPGKPVSLTQLSMSPRVFTVDNFMTEEEMKKIRDHNEHLVKPSEVGFSGWRDSTRTSHTAWDQTSWAARKVHKRSFDLVAMGFDSTMADAVQVLRYENTEWYKPHCDWFDSKGYEGHDPTVNNGTNRFATVFLYLSDVEEGGETVFPFSTTHKGYNGEQLVHKGTEKTPGYIANKDAQWVCNSSSTALRTKPKAGSAVLFYSQGPRGELDPLSLHGGCPVIKGTKWSANVWLWNRPKPSKDAARPEDKKKRDEYKKGTKTTDTIRVTMKNTFPEAINVFWDDGSEEMMFQMKIEPEEVLPMDTFKGHHFVARDEASGKQVGSYRAKPEDNYRDITFS